MDNSTVTWIVIALVLLAVLIVVGAVLSRRRQAQQVEVQRTQARELREKAEVDRIEVQRREAEASRIDAQARLAQAGGGRSGS
jgi:beta-lactamase regulating signal transducer with metallopeptidase domain